ncbi:MAG: ABC transporter permease [Alteromonadaceae bacterium]
MNLFTYQLKQAFLSLKKKPGFVFSVISTMGITLGALLCVLTLAYVMLIKPLPYPDQDRLYRVDSQQFDAAGALNVTAFSYPSLVHLYRHQQEKNQQVFDQVALSIYDDEVLTSLATQPTLSTAYVTPEWFKLTAASMAIGRPFSESEHINSNIPVAVLSYQTWVNDFAEATDILDEKVTFRGISFQVIGVLSSAFIEPKISTIGRETNVWLPFNFNAGGETYRARWWDRANNLTFIGKLAKDENVAQAQVTQLVNETWQENIDQNGYNKGWHIETPLLSFQSVILGESGRSAYLLLLGVIGLLAIAFINIANLQLSRTVEKKNQLALRAAVGAKRKDLFSVLFTESFLLMFGVLQTNLQQVLPRVNELSLGLFTLTSAVITSLLLAILFALLSYRAIDLRRLNNSIQTSGKGTGLQVSKGMRTFLVISQVTVATVLIFININLLKTSLQTIYDPSVMNVEQLSSVVLTQSDAVELTRAESSAITAEIQQKISELPQVSVASRNSSPLTDGEGTWSLTEVTSNQTVLPLGKSVDSHYFSLMGQNLLMGDNFIESHFTDRAPVLIINEQLAKQLVTEEQGNLSAALGKQLSFGGPSAYTIIGIVNDHKLPGKTSIPTRVYMPNLSRSNLLIKLKDNQTLTREQLVSAIKSTSKSISLFEFSTLAQQKAQRLFSQYTAAITTATLTVITFVLSAIGLYGILSYSTQMRRFEIGTRMAIGAKRSDLIKLIIKDNASAILLGVLLSVGVLSLLTIGFSEQVSHYITLELLPVFIVTLAMISILSLFACYFPLRQYINKPVIHALKGSE